eukprot:NODE_107_length_18988_cov_0.534491.p10 type:complete len:218 gc:universal NODE_107_length_18988_cov_0.534491:12758-13411(+)
MQQPVSLGTTIMACSYKNGIVLAADSRTTTGSYIANRVTDKLTQLHDNIWCLRSGSAADTQALADLTRRQLKSAELHYGHVTAKMAAHIMSKMAYQYRSQLSAGLIVVGLDDEKNKDDMETDVLEYSIYAIPLGGSVHKQPFTIGGSGSTFIYGYCDSHFKSDFNREECIEFVKNSVSLAMHRDGSSGGCLRYAVLENNQVNRHVVLGNELPQHVIH